MFEIARILVFGQIEEFIARLENGDYIMSINNEFVNGFLPCVGIVLFQHDIQFMSELTNLHGDIDIERHLGYYLANKYKNDIVKREIIIRLLSVYYRNRALL